MLKKLFGKNSNDPVQEVIANPYRPEMVQVTSAEELKSGDVLIARPYFQDPRFDRQLVLVTGTDDDNILGVTITRETDARVDADFPILKGNSAMLHWGGPGNDSQLYCLHTLEKSEHGISVYDHLSFEPDISVFLEKHGLKALNNSNSFFFKGRVQWNKKQLSDEIQGGDWAVSQTEIQPIGFDNSELWNQCFPGFETPLEAQIFPRLKANMGHAMFADTDNAPSMDIPEASQPISREFTEDLQLFFVEDIGEQLLYLTPKFFEEHPAFDAGILERMAVRNLIYALGRQLQVKGSLTDVVMVIAGGNFEASLVLVEGFMEQMHKQIGGDMAIGIPAQDLLFMTHASNEEGKDKIKQLIRKYFDDPETQGLLSKGVYLRKRGVHQLELIDHAGE